MRSLGRKKRFKIAIMFLGRRWCSREESPKWICESRCRQVVFVYMYLWDFLALKPFHDYSCLCSVCILPQSAFYSQSAVCILHAVCILPLVCSLQSAVRSLHFTLTAFYFTIWWLDDLKRIEKIIPENAFE